jgi:hypothetical protein
VRFRPLHPILQKVGVGVEWTLRSRTPDADLNVIKQSTILPPRKSLVVRYTRLVAPENYRFENGLYSQLRLRIHIFDFGKQQG